MKYCTKCGAELFDEAVVCIRCGNLVSGTAQGFTRPTATQANQAPTAQQAPATQAPQANQAYAPQANRMYAPQANQMYAPQANRMYVPQANMMPAAPKRKGPSAFLLASDFIYKIMLCLSLFFSALCIGLGKVKTELVTSSRSTLGFKATSVFATSESFAIFGVLFSFITLIFGVTSCIATLAGGHKVERVLSGISKLIVGIFLLLGTFMLLGNS